MSIPLVGQGYRGVDGHSGYLLKQAWQSFHNAMEEALRAHGISASQYAALSVLVRDPGSSGADLARACNTTAQAMNGVLAILERDGLIERHPHPTHGRILQAELTDEGRRRVNAATPEVRALEQAIEADFTADEIAVVKRWLVESARGLTNSTSRSVPNTR
jgi:DNA-binding MarR family transcriptional regulator